MEDIKRNITVHFDTLSKKVVPEVLQPMEKLIGITVLNAKGNSLELFHKE